MVPLRLLLVVLALAAPGPLRAAEPADAAPASHAVVFMYHRFGEDSHPSTSVRLDQFDAQLEILAKDYRVWPLERVVAHLAEGRPLPDRVVAITVDDAYASVYTEALPRLKAHGWPFTVFVATDAVDQGSPDLLTWDRMRAMRDLGARFANHSASHDHLVRAAGEDRSAWERRVRADIGRARQRLRAELGPAFDEGPPLFAYPYGEYDLELMALVRELGYTAFGQHSGAVGPASDPAALSRFPVSEAYGAPDEFRLKAASLPLPVTAQAPRNPLLRDGNPPRLELTVTPGDARLDALACYVSGQGLTPVAWLDRAAGRFAVTARAPLPVGRSRYNCTAPSAARPGRYYWFSHPWLRPAP